MRRPPSRLINAALTESIKLIIIHSDAIIDGRAAVAHTFERVFATMRPDRAPPAAAEVLAALADSPLLGPAYEAVGSGHLTSLDCISWFTRHRRVFVEEGHAMLAIYPDVLPLLRDLRRAGIAVAVLTSHSTLVEEVLGRCSLAGLVGTVVDKAHKLIWLPTAFRMVFSVDIIPFFTEAAGSWLGLDIGRVDIAQMLVVSCAPYNLEAPKLAGAKTCWVRKSASSLAAAANIDIFVDELDELRLKITGSIKKADEKREDEEKECVLLI